MKQKLWILTELFYPDEGATAFIMTNIARKMAEKYDVHVVCGPVTSIRSKAVDVDMSFVIHRTKLFNMNKDKLSHRTLRFIFISLIMTLKLYRKSNKDDKVLIVTNPAPLVPLVALVKRIRKFELTILVHDLFPENVISAGILKDNHSLLYRYLLKIFDRSYARADKIIVLGRDMEEIVTKKIQRYDSRAKIRIITNWADEVGIASEGVSDTKQVEIQYAGNIGRVQGLLDFIKLFESAGNEKIRLSLWGDGGMANSIQEYIEDYHLKNVEMKGPFTRNDQASVVGSCDLCLVTLAQGMYGLGVPSKTYYAMASGKPILYIGPEGSEIWRTVSDNGIGYCFSPTDQEGIKQFLQTLKVADRSSLQMMGDKARLLASTVYTKNYILNQFDDFV